MSRAAWHEVQPSSEHGIKQCDMVADKSQKQVLSALVSHSLVWYVTKCQHSRQVHLPKHKHRGGLLIETIEGRKGPMAVTCEYTVYMRRSVRAISART